MANANAELVLVQRLADRASLRERFDALQEALDLDEAPTRIECFDVSHSAGEATVASCVVFEIEGPIKSDYRRFNIKDIAAGDDYAAMHQALKRRYTRLRKEEAKMPDLLIIDGGKGQLGAGAGRCWRSCSSTTSMCSASPRAPPASPGSKQLHCLVGRERPLALAGRLGRAASHSTDSRRGSPLRHHRPPAARAKPRARPRSWSRSRASAPSAAALVERVRWPTGCGPRRRRGSRAGERDQPIPRERHLYCFQRA